MNAAVREFRKRLAKLRGDVETSEADEYESTPAVAELNKRLAKIRAERLEKTLINNPYTGISPTRKANAALTANRRADEAAAERERVTKLRESPDAPVIEPKEKESLSHVKNAVNTVVTEKDAKSERKDFHYALLKNEHDYGLYSKVGYLMLNEDADNSFGWESNDKYRYINDVGAARRRRNSMKYDTENDDSWDIYREMNGDERGIYNYLYSKEGEKSADEYLDSIEDKLEQRKGIKRAANTDGVISTGALAVESGFEQFKTGAKQLFHDDPIPLDSTQYAGEIVRDKLDEADTLSGKAGKFAYDLINSAANMAPSILVSAAIPVVGGLAGAATLGASAAGNAYNEKVRAGYDKDSAKLYAALIGTSEAAMQYLLGGIGKLGGKLSVGAFAKALVNVDNAFGKIALELGGNMLSEGFEEGLQTILEPLFAKIAFGEDYNVNWGDVAYSAMLGAASAGMLEGVGSISQANAAGKLNSHINSLVNNVDTRADAKNAVNELIYTLEILNQGSPDTYYTKRINDATAELTEKYNLDGAKKYELALGFSEDGKTREHDVYNNLRSNLRTTEQDALIADAEALPEGAERSGILLGVNEDDIRTAARTEKKLGSPVIFYKEPAVEGARINGYEKDGKIYINAEGDIDSATFSHEMTHVLESGSLYEKFSDYVPKLLAANGVDYEAYVKDIADTYEKAGFPIESGAALTREVNAHVIEDFIINDAYTVDRMLKDERTIFNKFADALNDTFTKRGRSMAKARAMFEGMIAKNDAANVENAQSSDGSREAPSETLSIAREKPKTEKPVHQRRYDLEKMQRSKTANPANVNDVIKTARKLRKRFDSKMTAFEVESGVYNIIDTLDEIKPKMDNSASDKVFARAQDEARNLLGKLAATSRSGDVPAVDYSGELSSEIFGLFKPSLAKEYEGKIKTLKADSAATKKAAAKTVAGLERQVKKGENEAARLKKEKDDTARRLTFEKRQSIIGKTTVSDAKVDRLAGTFSSGAKKADLKDAIYEVVESEFDLTDTEALRAAAQKSLDNDAMTAEARDKLREKIESYDEKIDDYTARFHDAAQELADLAGADVSDIFKSVAELYEPSKATKIAERYEARLEAMRKQAAELKERRERREIIRGIERMAKLLGRKLNNPTDESHVMDKRRGLVSDALEGLDFKNAPEASAAKLYGIYSDLTDAAADAGVDLDVDLRGAFEIIRDIKTPLAEMTPEQAHAIYVALANVNRVVVADKNSQAAAQAEAAAAASAAINDELADTEKRRYDKYKDSKDGVTKTRALEKRFLWESMTPSDVIKRFGATLEGLWNAARRGYDEKISITSRASEIMREGLYGVNMRRICGRGAEHTGAETVGITVENVRSGASKEIDITLGQAVSLVLTYRRAQGKKHLLNGGEYDGEGFTLKGDNKNYRMTESGYESLNETLLADKDTAALMDAVRKTLDYLAECGNDASMLRFGYKKFIDPEYFPLYSETSLMAAMLENLNEEYAVTPKNMGMARELNPHANNAVRIDDITDVIGRAVSDMSSYAGLLNPCSDLMRALNYKSDTGRRAKATLDSAFGKEAMRWLAGKLNDANGAISSVDEGGTAGKFMSMYKSSKVALNLSVTAKQPLSIIRAANVINPKYLIRAAAPFKGRLKAEDVIKYSPIMQLKEWGFSDLSRGRNVRELYAPDTKTAADKYGEASARASQRADRATWVTLYNAAQLEITDKQPSLGGKEFREAVNERFRDIIASTQVVNTPFDMPAIMRNQTNMNRLLYAFKGEPLKAYSNVAAAIEHIREPGGVKRFTESVAVYTLSLAATTAVTQIFGAFRDDDDESEKVRDKAYWNAFASEFGKDMLYDAVSFEPIADAITSLAEGFEPSRMDVSAAAEIMEAANKLYKYTSGEGSLAIGGIIESSAGAISTATGVPVKTVLRDVFAMTTVFAQHTDNYTLQYELLKYKYKPESEASYYRNKFYDVLFYAAASGDAAAYTEIKLDMMRRGVPESSIERAMVSRNGDKFDELYESWLGNPARYGELSKEMVNIAINPGTMLKELNRRYDESLDALYEEYVTDKEQYRESRAVLEKAGVGDIDEEMKKRANAEYKTAFIYKKQGLTNEYDDIIKRLNYGTGGKLGDLDASEIPSNLGEILTASSNPPSEVVALIDNLVGLDDAYDKAYEVASSPIDNATKLAIYKSLLGKEIYKDLVEADSFGVRAYDWIPFRRHYSQTDAKDENGNSVSGLKKKRVMDYINDMEITDEQKDKLFVQYYAESGLEDAPWHEGKASRGWSGWSGW